MLIAIPLALVTERIFSVILDGFIAHLGAVRDKSQRQDEEGNVNYIIPLFALHSQQPHWTLVCICLIRLES
jgi:hypothetical protein